MSLTDCKEVMDMGFDIGSHGLDHSKFIGLTNQQRQEQVSESLKFLHSRLGIEDIVFAFPNSSAGVDRDWMIQMIERNSMLKLFVTTNKMERNIYPMVNRINIDKSLTNKFEPLFNGFNYDVNRSLFISLLHSK